MQSENIVCMMCYEARNLIYPCWKIKNLWSPICTLETRDNYVIGFLLAKYTKVILKNNQLHALHIMIEHIVYTELDPKCGVETLLSKDDRKSGSL